MMDKAAEVSETPKIDIDREKEFEVRPDDITREFNPPTPPVPEIIERTEHEETFYQSQHNMEKIFQNFNRLKDTGKSLQINWPQHSINATLLQLNKEEHGESAVRFRATYLSPDGAKDYFILLRIDHTSNPKNDKWAAYPMHPFPEGQSQADVEEKVDEVVKEMAARLNA